MANPIAIIQKIQQTEGIWGDFIQNGPSDGIGGWVRDKYRDRCNQFANLPGWAQALSKPVAGSLARACQPYWDDQGTDGPITAPSFTGGQCPVLYTLTYSYNTILTDGTLRQPPTQRTQLVQGPVTNFRGEGLPEFQSITVQNPAGQTVTMIEGSCAQGCFANPTIVSLVRQDGLPDDCGDEETELQPGPNPPPDPGPLPGPEPTDDPRNPFGPPLVPIPPFLDPIYGPTPIVGDPDPTGPPGGGAPSGGDGLPGDPDAVGDEAGGAAGGEGGEDVDFGEPPEGAIWVGALVQAVVDSRLGNIPGTGPPQTVYPTVIGNASLIYTGARGTNERLESASTLLARATTALVLTGCRVQAQPGVDLTVRPISALTCPENPCEEQDG